MRPQTKRSHDHLSWGDAVFLYLEREGVPLHIAGVSLLEGIVSFEDCVRFVESKLPLIPRYRQRVVAPPFNIGRPTWEFDPDFDVRNHIREVTLERGTDSELKAVAGKVLGKIMDRTRPLWDITLVRGLKGDKTGFISRVHHCLADGVAGVGLMNVLLGVKPSAPPAARKRPRFRVPPPRDPWTSVVDGWVSSYTSIVDQVLAAQAEVLKIAERIVAGPGVQQMDQFTRLLPELAAPTEALHFNVTCRGPQKVAWAEFSLADIKAIKEACGCSVNDVALMLVTAAIRRYALRHGADIKGRLLRIMVPVNLRDNSRDGKLGNHISIIPVTIPLDIRSPRKLVAAVHERTQFLKKARVPEMVSLAGGLLTGMPSAFQALAGPLAGQLPITPFNLVCTNVPGPDCPLYLMGHKMLNWHPYVPVGGDMAVNVAILSYNGVLYFGFTGDTNAAPDLECLEKFLKLSMRELREAAGIHSRRREVARGKVRVVPAAGDTVPTSTPVPTSVFAAASPENKPSAEGREIVIGEVA